MPWSSGLGRRLMTKRLWVRIPNKETIFHVPFTWIQAWKLKLDRKLTWHCCMCCNPANGRVDIVELSSYKIQLHGLEWNESSSADWDQNPTKNRWKNCSSYFYDGGNTESRRTRNVGKHLECAVQLLRRVPVYKEFKKNFGFSFYWNLCMKYGIY